jgi:hypothetical protein
MFHGNCVKMCEDFCPSFDGRNWLLAHDNAPSHTSFVARQLLSKIMTVVPHPLTSLILRLKLKLKGRHFHTIEVTDAESQAMLNIFTKHDLQDAFGN